MTKRQNLNVPDFECEGGFPRIFRHWSDLNLIVMTLNIPVSHHNQLALVEDFMTFSKTFVYLKRESAHMRDVPTVSAVLCSSTRSPHSPQPAPVTRIRFTPTLYICALVFCSLCTFCLPLLLYAKVFSVMRSITRTRGLGKYTSAQSSCWLSPDLTSFQTESARDQEWVTVFHN